MNLTHFSLFSGMGLENGSTTFSKISSPSPGSELSMYFCWSAERFSRSESILRSPDAEIWKRFRKWGGVPTGATQNVKDLLSSPEIENILENSDFITLLNQASGDRKILSERLNLSADQQKYIDN